MALVFQVAPQFRFQHEEGQQTETQQVSFPRPVNTNIGAQVAIQAFNFDFLTQGPQAPLDRMEVSARQVRIGGNDVTVEVTVNFSAKPGIESEYNANVTVLVIADLL
jgi:hypothetical protein